MTKAIQVCETFRSLQGESRFSGYPTFFIRTVGCNLRCSYCDSTFSYEGGETMPVNSIMERAKEAGVAYVCVTGGEPMLQENVRCLLKELVDAGKWVVSLETNGSVLLKDIPEAVVKVVDVKLPGSGEAASFLVGNLRFLQEKDELKFVVTSTVDFQSAVDFIREHYPLGASRPFLAFSPATGMPPDQLAELLLQSGLLEARLQLQLHKILWGDKRGK